METMKTQQGLVLAHLLRHGSIDPMEAFKLYGCTRLGGQVFCLRQKGWGIRTERRKDKSGGMYAVYHMDEQDKKK